MVYALGSVKNPLYRIKTYETVEEWKDDGGEGKIVFETDEITDVSNFRICGKLIFCSPGLDIPEGITSIGREVFINEEQDIFDAWEIDTVNIPASVQTIEEGAFVGTEISAINIHPDSPCGIVKNNGLYTRDEKTLLFILGYTDESEAIYVVPEGVTRIALGAFTGYSLILDCPDSVTEIGYDAEVDSLFNGLTVRAEEDSFATRFMRELIEKHRKKEAL